MTAVSSNANRDRALFYQFVEQALLEYDKWKKNGDCCTFSKMLIAKRSDGGAKSIQTDNAPNSPDSLFDHTLNVIYSTIPTLKLFTPNMDGPQQGGILTYGLMFAAIQSGVHTPELEELLHQFDPINIKSGIIGPDSSVNNNTLRWETSDSYSNAFVIGLHRNGEVDAIAIRFQTLEGLRQFTSQDQTLLGTTGTFVNLSEGCVDLVCKN